MPVPEARAITVHDCTLAQRGRAGGRTLLTNAASPQNNCYFGSRAPYARPWAQRPWNVCA
eukprot:9631569-Lingulodinium_polyedra.AAC.1